MKKVLISSVLLGARHRKDMGDLSTLADSISAQGLLQPIGVTEANELVFGERRLRACRDILGWTEIPARVVNVTSILDGEHDENEVRKDFTPSERVSIGQAIEAKMAERRGRDNPQNIAELKGIETRQIAAKKAGFGNAETYRQAKSVTEQGTSELVDKMDAGEVSVSAAAVIAKQEPSEQARIIAEGKLKAAAAELREAEKQAKEADALPKAAPLSDEKKQEQQRILGTEKDRAILSMLDDFVERIDCQIPANEAARRIPPALHHAIDTAAIRRAATWLLAFSDTWEKEMSHGLEAAE